MILWIVEYFDIETGCNRVIQIWGGILRWERVLTAFRDARPGAPVVGIRPK